MISCFVKIASDNKRCFLLKLQIKTFSCNFVVFFQFNEFSKINSISETYFCSNKELALYFSKESNLKIFFLELLSTILLTFFTNVFWLSFRLFFYVRNFYFLLFLIFQEVLEVILSHHRLFLKCLLLWIIYLSCHHHNLYRKQYQALFRLVIP